jgi:hypothetical protein
MGTEPTGAQHLFRSQLVVPVHDLARQPPDVLRQLTFALHHRRNTQHTQHIRFFSRVTPLPAGFSAALANLAGTTPLGGGRGCAR